MTVPCPDDLFDQVTAYQVTTAEFVSLYEGGVRRFGKFSINDARLGKEQNAPAAKGRGSHRWIRPSDSVAAVDQAPTRSESRNQSPRIATAISVIVAGAIVDR